MQDTFFDSDRKSCCHGNAILWQKWGKNLASRTTSSVCDQFSWNVETDACLEVCVVLRTHSLTVVEWFVSMVTAYYGKNVSKNLASRTTSVTLFTNSHEIWHRCLPWGVDLQDTFFDSGSKCVAMVTFIWFSKMGEKSCVQRTTWTSVFHHFSSNLAQDVCLGV